MSDTKTCIRTWAIKTKFLSAAVWQWNDMLAAKDMCRAMQRKSFYFPFSSQIRDIERGLCSPEQNLFVSWYIWIVGQRDEEFLVIHLLQRPVRWWWRGRKTNVVRRSSWISIWNRTPENIFHFFFSFPNERSRGSWIDWSDQSFVDPLIMTTISLTGTTNEVKNNFD